MKEQNKAPLIVCKIVGVTFNDRQKVIQRLLKGKELLNILVHLVPEPDNPYDSNAIMVVTIPAWEQIGYVPRAVNEDILEGMKLGMIYERQKATIGCIAKNNGGYVYWGNVQIFESASSMGPKGREPQPDRPRRVLDTSRERGKK